MVIEDNHGDYILIEEYQDDMISGPVPARMKNFSGSKAVLSEKKTKFDVIPLDLSLPEKSG